MKTYIDKLRETSIENLKRLISQQESSIRLRQNSLETMKRVLKERTIKE